MEIKKVKFPYLAVFIGLYAEPILHGGIQLFKSESLIDVGLAFLMMLLGVPAVVTAVALWKGEQWSFKVLVSFFIFLFVFANVIIVIEGIEFNTEVFMLMIGYWVITTIILRYVYVRKKYSLIKNN